MWNNRTLAGQKFDTLQNAAEFLDAMLFALLRLRFATKHCKPQNYFAKSIDDVAGCMVELCASVFYDLFV